MMKRNIFILVLLLLAIAAAWFFMNRDTKKELKNFAVEDTASVNKIFMADRHGQRITLTRNADNSGWTANDKLPVNPARIQQLLETMKRVEVKSPVPETQLENVIRELAGNHVKVEIYQQDKLAKTYYVGNETNDRLGTFMLMEGSSKPFITHIPGFNGFLNVRYFLDEREWKDRTVFNNRPDEIEAISVYFYDDKANSFIVQQSGNSFIFQVQQPQAFSGMELDTAKVAQFFTNFYGLHYEGIVATENIDIDSLFKAPGFCTIEVKDKTGNINSLKVLLKPVDKGTKDRFDEKGRLLPFDRERMYAFVNKQKELVMIQVPRFERVMRKAEEFMVKK